MPEISLSEGRFRIIPARGSCFVGEKEVRLTVGELRTVYVLARQAGRIVPYRELATELGITDNLKQNLGSALKRLRMRLFGQDIRRRRECIVTRSRLGVMLDVSAL